MGRKSIEQHGYNQTNFTDGLSEQKERESYMCEVVSIPEFKKDKKRWQCMVNLLPDIWDQTRDQLCFVLAQKQAALDANKLDLIPGDVVKIGGNSTGKQPILYPDGSELKIQRFSLSSISEFSRAPRPKIPVVSQGTRRLLA